MLPMSDGDAMPEHAGGQEAGRYSFVVVACRLPVDRVAGPGRRNGVAAEPRRPGHRAGAGDAQGRRGLDRLAGRGRRGARAVRRRRHAPGRRSACPPTRSPTYYEGFCNATLWPLYHDVIAPPEFHRRGGTPTSRSTAASPRRPRRRPRRGATVWVHDYQLQLVPAHAPRARARTCGSGSSTTSRSPATRSSRSCPGGGRSSRVCSAPTCSASSGRRTRRTSCGPCRRLARLADQGRHDVQVPADPASPARRCATSGRRRSPSRSTPPSFERARPAARTSRPGPREIRDALGNPQTVLLGVDRLDYTKGILHRLQGLRRAARRRPRSARRRRCWCRWPARAGSGSSTTSVLRDEVEVTVGRINGEYGELGNPPVHYLHQSYPREEMAALYLAADVMLVTSLRDGMNLVAKEYVACRRRRERRAGAERVHRRRGRAAAARSWSTRTTSRA